MSKLHEIIAVEVDRKKTFQRIGLETSHTLTKKQQHFVGHVRKYEPIVDGTGTFDDEVSHIVTSVPEKLKHFEKSATSMLDIVLCKELSNVNAKADIKIKEEDGEPILIAEQVPVQALVQFENLLTTIRDSVYNNIPTLDPKSNWYPDEAKGKGFYKTAETRKRKTSKEQSFIVVVDGTEHNKPEIREVTKDVQVGNWVEASFSGMLSPADKSDMLERVGKLIEAVKQARARANHIDAEKAKIASKFFKYINEGTV